MLAAWGYGANGGKVLLHLMAGSKEDTETVTAFFQAAQPGPKGGAGGWPGAGYGSASIASLSRHAVGTYGVDGPRRR